MGLFTISCNSQDNNVAVQKESVHQFVLTDLNGDTFNMSSLKGKKVMIVNTASKCGLTYQYEILEKMYNSYKGSDMHPLYKFLTNKQKNGFKDSSVKWNFQKYLINENGYLEKIISPRTKPDDPSVIEWIKT